MREWWNGEPDQHTSTEKAGSMHTNDGETVDRRSPHRMSSGHRNAEQGPHLRGCDYEGADRPQELVPA
jgi:hypothetical protein